MSSTLPIPRSTTASARPTTPTAPTPRQLATAATAWRAAARAQAVGRRRDARPPAADRRAEGLLLPRGLALRRRPQRHRRDRRLAPHRRVRLPEPRRDHRHHDDDGHPLRVPDLLPELLARQARRSRSTRVPRRSPPTRSPRGEVRPNPAMAKWLCGGNYTWLCKQVAVLLRGARAAGKYQLYLWPPHCLLGSDGHALAGVVHEARLFHAFARARAVVRRGQGRQPADRELLGAAARGAVALRRRAARAAQHAVPHRRCSPPTRCHRRPGREPLREEHDRRPARRDRGAGSRAREEGLPAHRLHVGGDGARRQGRLRRRLHAAGRRRARRSSPTPACTSSVHRSDRQLARPPSLRARHVNDDKKIKKLLDDAHQAGALSAKSLATLDVVDVGAQIQAGLGVHDRRRRRERGRAA